MDRALKLLCPITKHKGKTLGDVLREDPKAIVWVANKFKGDEKISAGARLICEQAMQGECLNSDQGGGVMPSPGKGRFMQLRYQMNDILPLLPVSQPPYGKTAYNIPCPICDAPGSRGRHLNINLKKNVFCCPKCGEFSGGVFDLYAYYEGVPRCDVLKLLRNILGDTESRFYAETGPKHKKSPPHPPEIPQTPLADIERRHRVYSALLECLPLANDHWENLRNRGLSDDAVRHFQYRTAPTENLQGLAQNLIQTGCDLYGVPGFYRDAQGGWTLASYRRGIMIPCRDRFGRIQSLHIRLDKKLKRGGKFLTFSSTDKPDGAGAENWCHIAGPIQPEILLIEGYMKADIVHHFTGRTVLAIPGVTSTQQLITTLKELSGLGVRRVMTCFDMDYMKNWHVENAYRKLLQLLSGLDITFGTYLWDPAYNGLDDYIWESCMKRGERNANLLEAP